jgi:signal peptidase II
LSFEMSKIRYLLIVAIVLLDQITKFSVRGLMYIGESIPVIEDIFHITYVQNRGAAFSLFSGSGVMLIIIPIAALLLAIWYMEKHKGEHWTLTLSLCLIISGGLGNLIDRVFMGFVTDMFDFRIWPVFNVADIAVCLGAGFLILYTLAFYGKTSEANNI